MTWASRTPPWPETSGSRYKTRRATSTRSIRPPTGPLSAGYSTSSTTFVDLGFPSVSAYIGASGSATLMVSALITTSAAAQGGFVGVEIDGVVPGTGNPSIQSLVSGSGVEVSASSAWVQPHMAPQTAHTFKLVYRAAVGATSVTFTQNNLIVWPI